MCRCRNLGRGNVHEHVLQRIQLHIARLVAVRQAQSHFLTASTARNHAHAHFHQADIAFGGGLHTVGMERHFAAAAQRQARRSHHHRNGRVPDAHHRVLELADHHFHLVVFLFYGVHEQHGKVGSRREIITFVGNHQAAIILLGHRNRLVDAFNHFGPDGVHLGAELQVQHAVADVKQRGSGVFPHHFVFAQRVEQNEFFRSGN